MLHVGIVIVNSHYYLLYAHFLFNKISTTLAGREKEL